MSLCFNFLKWVIVIFLFYIFMIIFIISGRTHTLIKLIVIDLMTDWNPIFAFGLGSSSKLSRCFSSQLIRVIIFYLLI